jgi:hypothetical protein
MIKMREYLKNHPTVFTSTSLFIFTTIMIGYSSHGIRIFLQNYFKTVAVSLFLTLVLYGISGLNKNSKYNIPFIFFWASIFFALTVGSF